MRGDTTTHRHHVRRVQWLVTKPVDLEGGRFFIQGTLGSLDADRVSRIREAYLEAYPHDAEIGAAVDQLFGPDVNGGGTDGM